MGHEGGVYRGVHKGQGRYSCIVPAGQSALCWSPSTRHSCPNFRPNWTLLICTENHQPAFLTCGAGLASPIWSVWGLSVLSGPGNGSAGAFISPTLMDVI